MARAARKAPPPRPDMTEADAARELGFSLRTLQRLRAAGQGPSHYRLGRRRIRYTHQDVVAWLQHSRRKGVEKA